MTDRATADQPDDNGAVPVAGRGELFSRWQEPSEAMLSARQLEMRRLAASMRRIIEQLVDTVAPIDAIVAAADDLDRVATTFDLLQTGKDYEGYAEAANAGYDPTALFEHSPFIGGANPLAPPLRLEEVDGVIHGHGVFGAAYEGPPASVHGGYVAAAFDEVLGATQSLSGSPGMTGTLTVKYRSPTPLHTDLFFVGELVRVEGRKIFTEGRLYAGDRLCAEAEGIFITVPAERFAALMRERGERA